MNKSEIAERAARYKAFTEQLERNAAEVKIGINDNSPLAEEKRNYISGLRGRIEERKNAMELVERAIAESQPQPKIRWRTGKCEQDTRPHLENAYHICHDWRAELGDGEPSPIPTGSFCGKCGADLVHGCNAERCIVEQSGAAQEVSPFASILPENAEPKLDMRMDDDLEEVSPPSPELVTKANDLLRRLNKEVFNDAVDMYRLPEAVGWVIDFAKENGGDTRELKAALRWIPVEEKWPEVNAYVWFWVPSLGQGGNWETGYFRDDPDEGAEFECEGTGPQDELIVYDDQQVTHWMLAELPKPDGSD